MIGVQSRRAVARRPLHRRATAPVRTEVRNAAGTLLATFTDGARTVSLLGAERTFTETKPPVLDQFARTVSSGWGPSPNGGTWGNFGGVDADFSVSAGKGRISAPTTNTSRYTRLADDVTTYDMRTTVTTDTMPVGAANVAALIGGWASTTAHMRYQLTLNPSGLVSCLISRVVGGTATTIAGSTTVGTSGTYVAGQVWHIRATFDGTTHTMRAWKDGDTEPVSPNLSVADTTYPTGRMGVRTLAATSSTNNPVFLFDDFTATAAWPANPTITHSTWVRVLPAAFAGIVNPTWLAAALADTSLDVLALSMQYITGAATVMDGPQKIAGDAHYGPLNAAGGRDVGADFNDYLGLDWTYTGVDSAESAELDSLDCSGFLRIVWGYRAGLPLSLNAVGSGQLPRVSRDQLDSGPGVIIVPRTGAQITDLTPLRIGDIVGFDATADLDEYDGEIDHTGIYLGLGTDGAYRFISSRKTPDGPTFADMGGPSRLDGSGIYARKLRTIRRF
ncbi:hypothetical protein [Pseudonocardia broussonetiae]|uniref:NlpC/P60 domain-containing protein n=1 Tax=Pseudonocardia broussonetiae TaxID=2736640 RepID=A0A6M6JJP1_9PSEU|nr:hypothetical protein [Pseudonocardia broussonetiae]QJY46649.1 hypothetical protein HOP40_13165 [Pseudonocardia broussonetiae]